MDGKKARQHMEHIQMIITTWVQEDRGGGKARQGKARQGRHPPSPNQSFRREN